jgi:hypothetical protein
MVQCISFLVSCFQNLSSKHSSKDRVLVYDKRLAVVDDKEAANLVNNPLSGMDLYCYNPLCILIFGRNY